DEFLLLLSRQPVEVLDDFICFAAVAVGSVDGVQQVGGAAIVEEEDALSNAPEGSGAELVGAGAALRDAVGETLTHVMDDKIRVKIRCLIGERSTRTGGGTAGDLWARGERGRMAVDATYLRECGASFLAGRRG